MAIGSLSLQRNSLSKKELIWYIFLFLNLLALFQFGLLQVRTIFPDYYSGNIGTSFLRLMTSYNAWALGALVIIIFKPKKSKWYQHLTFFLSLIILYSLASATVYNSNPYQIWRGFVMNITGLINLNLLFYLTLVTTCRYFLVQDEVDPDALSTGLSLKDGRTFRHFDKTEIVYIKSEQNYVLIKSKSTEPVLVRKTLKEIESRLSDDENFVRIQRSYIVNSNFISKASTLENGIDMECMTSTGDVIPVSRYKKAWLKSLETMSL